MAPIAPYLPQELVDSIIDHVYNDRPTLASCALVSRSWLHSSRYHLFATIHLTPQPNIPIHRLCARLYQLLQDTPSIIPYIRQLQLFDGVPPHQHSGQWIANERTLPPLLKLLTHLRSLEICASSGVLHWKSLPFTLQNAICTVLKLPSLTYFRLYSWTFPNFASLAAVLSLCQNLRGLSLSSVTVCDDLDLHSHHSDLPSQTRSVVGPQHHPLIANVANRRVDGEGAEAGAAAGDDTDYTDESNEDTANTRVETSRLEVLTLDNVNFGYLGNLVLAPPQSSSSPINFRNLRELRVARSADPLIVEQILVSVGPSLEHLHLKPGHWDVYPFDLRHNLNLRSLTLTLEVPETALSWCTTLLSSLSPYNLSTSRSAAAASSSWPSSSSDTEEATAPQLTRVSLEFWTDLKRLSSVSQTVSPSASPDHVPLSLSPATSSSPPPSSPSYTLPGASSSSHQSTMPSSSSHTRSLSPEQQLSSPPRGGQQQQQRRSLLYAQQPTWTSLDSVLSHLPSPLKEVNVGLFAQPSHPDFLRVKEALSGIHARMYPDDLTKPEVGVVEEEEDDDDGDGDDDDGDDDDDNTGDESSTTTSLINHEREEENGKTGGIVRVYQLGVKSQRSFGRMCGPRLRFFEGLT